jgi:hypothetical protein
MTDLEAERIEETTLSVNDGFAVQSRHVLGFEWRLLMKGRPR